MSESLATLVDLLERFFSHTTSNQQKQVIESSLASFSAQDGAWKNCLEFMNVSSNNYVLMFCLGTLEMIITRKWLVLMVEEKSQMTSFLYQYSLERFHQIPPFIRNKLLKLVADIARYDWPHFYPNYMTNIISLIQSNDLKTANIGLAYLLTTSEELICPREDISNSRKEELKNLFIAHLPQISSSLIGLFNRVRNVSDAKDVVQSALKAICHIFSWLPLQSSFPRELLIPICEFSTNADVGDTALATINELLYKNCVPMSFLPYLGNIACHLNSLFFVLTKNEADVCKNKDYTSSVYEMVRLLITNHWHRLEANENFPLFEFLGNLFQLTYQRNLLRNLRESWIGLIDYLHDKNPEHIARYEDVLLLLAQATFEREFEEQRMSFFSSAGDVLGYDDEDSYEDLSLEENDWGEECNSVCREDKIRLDNFNLIVKIADLIPSKIAKIILEAWQPAGLSHAQLMRPFNENIPQEISKDILRALIYVVTSTGALGLMYYHFEPEQRPVIIESLVTLAELVTKTILNIDRNPIVSPILDHLHYQIMLTLKSWLRLNKGDEGVEQSLKVCTPLLINHMEQPWMQKDAAVLLLGVTFLPRSRAILTQMEPLFSQPLTFLPRSIWTLKQLSLMRCLLFWNWEAKESDTRLELLTQVIKQTVPEGIDSLKDLIWILRRCRPVNKESKELLCTAVLPVLEKCIQDFPSMINNEPEKIIMILKLYIEAFKSFQEFLGSQFFFESVSIFISAFQSINLNENSNGFEELLRLLTIIVEQPSNCYKLFVPSCLELCLDHIYPHIALVSSPQIKPAFFNLFKSILTHRWNYFYSGSLMGSESVLEQEERFRQIMMAFGQSLTQTDITVFKQNLQTLEMLNQKWKLYHKDIFRLEFLGKFLTVLLNSLVEKSHALLSEEIATAVFNMAAVDFSTFFNNFIPHFLSETAGIDSHQRDSLYRNTKQDTDLPSFSQNIQRLVNDVRCYRVCNGTSSPVSVG
ncbi:hypothetical protein LSTR_LSTR008921 [Laodelphax striatellus]|uniref:Exportin-1/Importin-beta-like domain-containing protein n=1 Tax=Laodelphax striatellus TaxID=195883 RepID=A0A482WMD2_LAOST|nr:hypothetical protein LSTR_LSTR008921 [Laodelphax striatellus]